MQGFNMGRYYPPDASNPPTFNASSHPLGKRANKISQGILTVRFELPFAVWCEHCSPPAIVGQGVRFNAEKKKVGHYYSTPIWSFRIKHSACGGWWEIRTDPKNAEYSVVEGARKRDYGPGVKSADAEGDLKFLTEEEKARRRNDAFANLESKIGDKALKNENKERVEELYDISGVWRDPYDVNARLREGFREKRKVLQRDERQKEGLQDKFSLGIDIADETEADRMRASVTDFGKAGQRHDHLNEQEWKPLFVDDNPIKAAGMKQAPQKLNSDIKAAQSRKVLQQALIQNTKAAIDPFTVNSTSSQLTPLFGLRKKTRRHSQTLTEVSLAVTETTHKGHKIPSEVASKKKTLAMSLVDYDSD
ncbi:CWC16 protein [Phaeosphaeria sp. MPI-PUGE-AT-0046c]|nr:CWC16 protein [Phaeosphaeria sp. MPI-PUGE-AT-0046c]